MEKTYAQILRHKLTHEPIEFKGIDDCIIKLLFLPHLDTTPYSVRETAHEVHENPFIQNGSALQTLDTNKQVNSNEATKRKRRRRNRKPKRKINFIFAN